MILNAAQRLTAATADEKQALRFLQELGFSGLRFKNSEEDRIRFFYSEYKERFLIKHFGKPTILSIGKKWYFGSSGNIIVRTNGVVVLRNAKDNTKPVDAPIETHVPEHVEPVVVTPQDDPNVPGAKDNDDSQVPVTHISDELVKFYTRAQNLPNDRMFRRRFIALLWHYLNKAKFSGLMKEPKFNLLNDQAAYRMRLRGRWWPKKRVLDIAPRLFNAHQDFFVEIMLHEMCHQAVSEIDHADWDTSEQGHGPYWRTWMTKVGLNPRRFDPNDNSTYMTEDEKEAHQELLEKRKQALDTIQQQGLQHLHTFNGPKPATAVWNGHVLIGLLVCPTVKSGKMYAFFDINSIHDTSFKLVPPQNLYEFSGTDEQRHQLAGAAYQQKALVITLHIQQKAADRAANRRRHY